MLQSQHLWQEIYQPDESNPIYQRAYAYKPRLINRLLRVTVWFFAAIFLAFGSIAILSNLFYDPPIFTVIAIPFASILFAAHTISGMGIASSITNVIKQESEQDTLDILGVTPDGIEGVFQQLALGASRRARAYREMLGWRRGIFVSLVMVPAGFIALLWLTIRDDPYFRQPDNLFATGFMLSLLTIFAFTLRFDNMQSVVAAVQTGLLASKKVKNRASANTFAIAGFLTLQLLTYILSIAFAVFVVNLFPVSGSMSLTLVIASFLAILVWALAHFTMREGTIRLLVMWRNQH